MTGWTMNEIRAHQYGDLVAMTDVLEDERRARKLARG